MCVGFWALEHPEYALILCTNRDEYLSRPTVHAGFHCFDKAHEGYPPDLVLSGRDLQAGGTWFGMNRYGEVGLLTNITEAVKARPTSRGDLVSTFLLHDSPSAANLIADLPHAEHTRYAGFNLLLFTLTSSRAGPSLPSGSGSGYSYTAALVTNSGGDGALTSRPLTGDERHAGGLSNGIDSADGSCWPKVQTGRKALSQLLENLGEGTDREEDTLVNGLFELLSSSPSPDAQAGEAMNPNPMNRSELRRAVHIKPIRMTHSLAPDAPADGPEYYGTRLSTVVLVRRDGRVLFVERDIWQLADADDSDVADKAGGQLGGGVTVVHAKPDSQRVFRFHIAERQLESGGSSNQTDAM